MCNKQRNNEYKELHIGEISSFSQKYPHYWTLECENDVQRRCRSKDSERNGRLSHKYILVIHARNNEEDKRGELVDDNDDDDEVT